MIVEFIGASGAGKTSLIASLATAPTSPPMTAVSDLLHDRPPLRNVREPHLQNLLDDVMLFPSFVRGGEQHRRFVRFAASRLRRSAPSTFARYNYLREIVRDVGKHRFARAFAPGATVLLDEGPLITASHLFVYSRGGYDDHELERFIALAPLPDRVVYVRAPIELLVERAVARRDRRRELSHDENGERRLRRAVEVFDRLVASPTLGPRAIVVESVNVSEARDVVARSLAHALDETAMGVARIPDVDDVAVRRP